MPEQPSPAAPPPPRRHGFVRRHLRATILGGILVVPAALLALWTAITLNYTYSSGDRVGFVQKLSKKGWLCKTNEGELAMSPVPGSVPQIFRFTVRDEAVAEQIMANQGKQLALTYEEHRGIPTSCFGETDYFVTGVRVLGNK